MSTYIVKRAAELGIPIVDASKAKKLEVIQSDIDKAKQKNAKMCGFARAAERDKEVTAAFFLKSMAYLEYSDKIVRYQLPTSMQKEIVAFDRAKAMEPGIYQLAAVRKTQSLAAMRKRTADRKERERDRSGLGKRRTHKRFQHMTTDVRSKFDPTYRAAK